MEAYQVEETNGEWGGVAHRRIVINGKPRALPCGMQAAVGDWLVVMSDKDYRDHCQIQAVVDEMRRIVAQDRTPEPATETDEVIVVKQNARRVWIEQANGIQCCHEYWPLWEEFRWTSGGGQLFPLDVSPLEFSGLPDRDCIEFVEVCRHRPPETEKPVATQMETDIRTVRQACPNAVLRATPDCRVYVQGAEGKYGRLSLACKTEEEAWGQAATIIRNSGPFNVIEPSEDSQPHSDLGCGIYQFEALRTHYWMSAEPA